MFSGLSRWAAVAQWCGCGRWTAGTTCFLRRVDRLDPPPPFPLQNSLPQPQALLTMQCSSAQGRAMPCSVADVLQREYYKPQHCVIIMPYLCAKTWVAAACGAFFLHQLHGGVSGVCHNVILCTLCCLRAVCAVRAILHTRLTQMSFVH